MSESGTVIIRLVYPVPALLFPVNTVLAPKSRSLALRVVAAPLSAAALLPVAVASTSNGLAGSNPLYSKMRMSGALAAGLNFTVTVFAPAAAAAIFFA
jgi:hypothetical protein